MIPTLTLYLFRNTKSGSFKNSPHSRPSPRTFLGVGTPFLEVSIYLVREHTALKRKSTSGLAFSQSFHQAPVQSHDVFGLPDVSKEHHVRDVTGSSGLRSRDPHPKQVKRALSNHQEKKQPVFLESQTTTLGYNRQPLIYRKTTHFTDFDMN